MTINITIDAREVKVNGRTVATITDNASHDELSKALFTLLKKDESVYLAVYSLAKNGDGVRTSEIARFLGMDRSNCTKALERLLEEGRVRIAGSTEWSEQDKGRPSRLWLVA